jgi:hypothetical protein
MSFAHVLPRSLCIKCLCQLVVSYLARNAGSSLGPLQVAWLDKVVKPILANARKGAMKVEEQQVGCKCCKVLSVVASSVLCMTIALAVALCGRFLSLGT